MQLTLQIGSRTWRLSGLPADISIPLLFNGPQPNTYGVSRARSAAYETGAFVGDTRRGGSCNFEEYTLVPHCNGTHTECIGHIALDRISIVNELKEALIPAVLATVVPEIALTCGEAYSLPYGAGDKVITARALKQATENFPSEFFHAMIIRTSPNPESKKAQDYMAEAPAFFTLDAMHFMRAKGVAHLLTDLPSVDRLFDEGKLGAHRVYWGIPEGEKNISVENHSASTITEMIYVPDRVKDGIYLLNLQIAPFVSDAAPSRPMLFGLE